MPEADDEYLHLLSDVDFQPVFILGDHRSGTTILYEMLRKTGAFNIVTAYHIIAYRELLRNHVLGRSEEAVRELELRFSQLGIRDRGIDKISDPAHIPEEYGFFLGRGNRLNSFTLPRFYEGCRKIQYISAPGRPLLLKNPWDYGGNFLAVRRYFPKAPIIFIHRNPADVMNSKLRALRTILKKVNEDSYFSMIMNRPGGMRPVRRFVLKQVFGTRYGPGARIIGRGTVLNAKYYMKHINKLDRTGYHPVRYEDLCDKPTETVEGILGFLGAECEESYDFTGMIKRRQANILPEFSRYLPGVSKKLRSYCKQFDYVLPCQGRIYQE